MSTVFSKIINKDLDADMVYEDDLVVAFRDINPQAPTHILIVPRREIATVNDTTEGDEVTLGRMIRVAGKIAHDEGIDDTGYRLMINCNEHGGQEVFHLHMHLLGGKPLGPMLCK